ncbi:MAG: flagellar protein FlaG, partial [Clostridium sp.]
IEKNNNNEEQKGFDKKELNRLIKELNKHLEKEDTYAKYDVHEKLGDIMIKIVSKETKEVIIEFPPEKILDMVAKLCENAGIVLNKKA